MLWEIEIHPASGQRNREAMRIQAEVEALGLASIKVLKSARSFLIEGDLSAEQVKNIAVALLVDSVVETAEVHPLPGKNAKDIRQSGDAPLLLNVLLKPGVTDNVANTAARALSDLRLPVERAATCRKYWISPAATPEDVARLAGRVLANDSIEHVIIGDLPLESIAVGSEYRFKLQEIPLRSMAGEELERLSRNRQLYLSLTEMVTIQQYFRELGREPTDIELETIAQTWSEHCSHKTLAGRIRYRDSSGERLFENMLKETIFAATQSIRGQLGADDWCVSVFRDNAGIVRFDEKHDVCIKVETHNHPSALEPYGGANTGLGGVIRDPLGTGLGARPVCNTDVFCFAPPDTPHEELPPGVLHPRTVMRGVVAGVRDYGNRMGIPTVNGAVYFDRRYLGNPLVYCGNVAILPRGKSEKRVVPGDLIVAVGGRTGRDGIHGATFSSAELTEESEELSGGAVQIGNAITEKMLMDVILEARDRNLYHAITDCGAGGFSSAIGEMGEESGAEVWLEKAPLKYSGLSYTEIWISEAQERMVLAVPPENWEELQRLCASEGVEASVIGEFTDTRRLLLTYDGKQVGELEMSFLHEGRPPVVREAIWSGPGTGTHRVGATADESGGPGSHSGEDACGRILKKILASLNVCSKEWIIRQYDHEVQAGSVVKPLVGLCHDGPSDAAIVRPVLESPRGLVIACGMNPHYGELDPYWMAASAIDEAVRNCVAVGADPSRIAILDNFCWGNTERPETLGTLVRAALGCHDIAVAYGTPFVSGKDSLNNEFRWQRVTDSGDLTTETIAVPPSLLISALGQIGDIRTAVTMDLKQNGNLLLLVGQTLQELGGSHYQFVTGDGRDQVVPRVNLERAPLLFSAVHQLITQRLVRSCHDLSEGGLAVSLAEMAFAGGFGADVTLENFGELEDVVVLFSESNSRFLLEVEPANLERVNRIVRDGFGIAPLRLGSVTDSGRLIIKARTGREILNEDIAELKNSWQSPLMWD